MHILELPSFFPPHGGLFCLEQAKALKAAGHEVRIVSVVELGATRDGGFFLKAPWGEEHLEMEGVEVWQGYLRALPRMVQSNNARWIKACCRMVRRYIRRFGPPDVIHAHCCKSAGLAARIIGEAHGIPYFITEHISSGLFHRDFGQGWQRHRWLQHDMLAAYQAARCVIPVSRELVDDLSPFFGRDYRHQVVSNIIDTDFFAFRQREPRAGRPFRFCCLALADIHGKGYDVLADAMRRLPADIELHIAGKGTDGQALRGLFDGMDNVHIHGFLDKAGVRDLLYRSDALVLPSRSEAQPLVLLEAMATGIPVVTTECIPDSVRIAGACLTCPVGDAQALALNMQEATHIAPSPTFSEAVRSLASPEVVAAQLAKLFTS